MDLLKFIFMSLITMSAFALEPKVGDATLFKGTAWNSQGTVNIEMRTSIDAFDAASNSFTMTTTTETSDGSVEEEVTQMKYDEMASMYLMGSVIALYCSRSGGTREVLTTPAGVFNSCRVPNDNGNGYTWFGSDIPFLFLKATGIGEDEKHGEYHYDITINDFVLGS